MKFFFVCPHFFKFLDTLRASQWEPRGEYLKGAVPLVYTLALLENIISSWKVLSETHSLAYLASDNEKMFYGIDYRSVIKHSVGGNQPI